jgi:histidinol-phosphate aminotransferase
MSLLHVSRSMVRHIGPEPRREVLNVPPTVHGSIDVDELRRLGLAPDDVLDFSANTNPYGPSRVVVDEVARVPLDQYPDRTCRELCAAVAGSLGVDVERVLPGNGAAELIWLAALAFVRAGSCVFIVGPTFSEYGRAARLMGAVVATWEARVETGFVVEPHEVASCLRSLRPHVVFLCNPNNPTGGVAPPEVLASWAAQHPSTLFVVDEAYLPFTLGVRSAMDCGDNVLVLRSMTKDFGLAGLRLGYAVGSARVIEHLRAVQPPWSVNALAQAAGMAALRDLGHRQRTLAQLALAKEELVAGMMRLGLNPVPSATHFFLVEVGDGAQFRAALLRRGVLVRDCSSFGLPQHIRISTRRPEENVGLLAVVREVLP